MLNIFHFSHKPPFPLNDGGCVAISSVLKSLLSSSDFSVFHFTLHTHKHPFNLEKYPQSWKDRMEISSKYINTKTDLFGALYYLLMDKSYNLARFYDKKVAAELVKIFEKKSFDVVFLESIYTLPYLSVFKKHNVKIIVRAHNVEHRIWEQLAEKKTFPISRWYHQKLSSQLKKYEEETLKKVDGIIAISEEDALYFQQFEPSVTTTAIPTAVRTNFPPPDYSLDDFYFLGAMDWLPNREGVDWLLNKVIPEGLTGTTLTIAGKSLKEDEIEHPEVICQGEVDNALDFISSHGICVIPMKSGSGIKIKLLENMAMGKPIVTTLEGIRGIPVENKKEVYVADEPGAFREAMYALHLDKNKRSQLGEAAKKFVINNYGEEKITRRLIAFIKDI